MSYVQGLSDTVKMERMVEMMYYLFCGASLLEFADTSQGEVFSPCNIPKEKEKWKSKCKTSIYEQNVLQEKMLKLQA